MATDTPNSNPAKGESTNSTNSNEANAPAGDKKTARKKVEMPPELDQLMKELAGNTGGAAGTNNDVGRIERRLNILEAAFTDIVERHESSLRDRSAQLAAVEANVLALRNRVDQSDKHHAGAATELRAALANANMRLNGVEAQRQDAPTVSAPAPVSVPMPVLLVESNSAEIVAPSLADEHHTVPTEADAAAAESSAAKPSSEGLDYLSAARRAANAWAGDTDAAARPGTEAPRRANRVRLALVGGVAPALVVAGAAFFFVNRHPVTAQPVMKPSITAPSPKQANAAPAAPANDAQAPQTKLTPPPDVVAAAPADPTLADIISTAASNELEEKASHGDAVAARDLGLKYLTGNGVTANEDEAVGWILRAAYKGEPAAEYWLGTLYARGRGVPADVTQALHWYEEAAKQGNPQAMHQLGIAYFVGQNVAKNEMEAARWFSQAAELGNVDSAFNLGVLYERGAGVKQSLGDAYKWYAIAARQGDKESASRVATLAKQLKPAELQTATREAAEFKAKSSGVASSK